MSGPPDVNDPVIKALLAKCNALRERSQRLADEADELADLVQRHCDGENLPPHLHEHAPKRLSSHS